jgi:Bacteriocin-protection, YdeI or OmpD-Associated
VKRSDADGRWGRTTHDSAFATERHASEVQSRLACLAGVAPHRHRRDGVEELQVPPDLSKALASHPNASENFDAFPRSVKRGILEWILVAKRAETRAQRIDETARLASENVRANQWRGKTAP